MLDNSYGDETLEELTDAVIMMARIQPANDNGMQKRDYDAKAVIEVIQHGIWIIDNGVLEAYDWQSTVRFRNDHLAAITRYGDYVQGNLTIYHVYYIEGLRHNLFLVGQFYDGDLEVAFRSNTFYVWNLESDDLLTSSCESNLYTISISELEASSLVCLMSKATSIKSWLWHRRLSHLNFGTINQLTSKVLVDGILKFKLINNSVANTLDVKDTPSPSSINVEDSDDSQIVTSSEEPITQESSILVLETYYDEQF
uniref:Integrase, catalytic region, zinc finger, CCHC-type, peptidase aspartic, catalytic n=1 Tax=Tanacetum cinerariifolium TaxID=118510 RepID=A0A6L2LE99_TANCI|nr:integrase, catalytic region, zinc finger, CCHC-type, peptidase aspartic, catalytic [Tanacetum cinerariifolium]